MTGNERRVHPYCFPNVKIFRISIYFMNVPSFERKYWPYVVYIINKKSFFPFQINYFENIISRETCTDDNEHNKNKYSIWSCRFNLMQFSRRTIDDVLVFIHWINISQWYFWIYRLDHQCHLLGYQIHIEYFI